MAARGHSNARHAFCERRDHHRGPSVRDEFCAASARRQRGSLARARAGIADLGDDYRPKRVKDDTGLHVLDANGAVAAGKTEEGARSLISVLDARIGLYFQRYQGEARPL